MAGTQIGTDRALEIYRQGGGLAADAFMQALASENAGAIANSVSDLVLQNTLRFAETDAYVAGLSSSVASLLKFKQHKDNPTQVPIGTPIALLFIAAALLFLPSILSTTGGTMFGDGGGVPGAYVFP
ncbi:MAG: type IV secretion protein IcmD [Candidatus Eremiobacterota bacterium]